MKAVAALLPLTLLLAGCSGGDGGDWPGRDLETAAPPYRNSTIDSGYGLEMDFALSEGDALPYDWFIMDRTPITFQIHYHEGPRDTTVSEQRLHEHTGPFVAQTDATYSFLWINDGTSPVEVYIQVEGEVCYPHGCATYVEL